MQKDKKQFQVKTSHKTNYSKSKSKQTQNIVHQINQQQHPVFIILNQKTISKFERLQPEIIYIISEFLTYDQYLKLRLINSSMNQRILQITILKLQSIQSKISYFEQQLDEQVKSKENYQQQENEYKNILQNQTLQINNLNKFSILEMRCYKNPPQLIQKILEYLLILLNYKIKEKDQNWNQIKQILQNPFYIVMKLESIKISDITQFKIQQLLPILEISSEQASNISSAGGAICVFIQQIIKANNNCQVIIQKEKIEREIKQNLSKQAHLNKIYNLNNN